MRNRTTSHTRFLLQVLLTVVCTTLMLIESIAQTNEVIVDTKISGPVTVCGAPILYTITIKNLSASPFQNIILYPNLPAGMTYVTGSAVNMTEVTPVDNNISFNLTDLPPVGAGESERVVKFSALAQCAIMVGLPASKLVNNETKITYQSAGINKVFLEPNGSDSYSVLSAQLELFVPEIEKSIAADFINVVKSRHVTVKNSGLGSISTLEFYLKADAELQVQKLELVKSGGNQVLSNSGAFPSGIKYVINNFSSFGDGDNLFEEGESFTLMDYVKVLTAKASIATAYTAQWGCSGQMCNSNDQQATFSVYITALGGRALVTQTTFNLVETNFCNLPAAEIKFLCVNTGSGNEPASRDAAFDVKWNFGTSFISTESSYQFFVQKNDLSRFEVTSVDNGTGGSTASAGIPATYYIGKLIDFTNRFTEDIDGPGGLSDVDEDGFYDDLPNGATLTIIAKVKPSFTGDIMAYNSLSNSTSGSFTFNSWSGIPSNQNNNSSAATQYTIVYSDRNLTGEADLLSSAPLKVKLNLETILYSAGYNSSNDVYEFHLEVPSGVNLLSAKYKNRNLTFSQNGNIVTIVDPLDRIPAFEIDFEFGLTCGQDVLEEGKIKVDVFYYAAPCSSSRIQILKLEKQIFLHCKTCATLETTSFTAVRKTLGWVPPSNRYYLYKELHGPNPTAFKVTEQTTGIKLNAAYPRDEVQVAINGVIKIGTYSSLSAVMFYGSSLDIELFHFKSAVLLVDNIEYNLPENFTPQITLANGIYRNEFTIPLGESGLPQNLFANQNLKLLLNYQVDELTSLTKKGEYDVSNFRGSFFGMGNSSACQDFGTSFKIYKYFVNEPLQGLSYNLTADGQAWIGYFTCSQGNKSQTNVYDFPNEFRPLYSPGAFAMTLPKGFIYDVSGLITISNSSYSTGAYSLPHVNYSSDKRTLMIDASEMPVMQESNLYMFANIKIDCENPDNLFVPVITNSDQRQYVSTYTRLTYPYLSVDKHVLLPSKNQSINLINQRRPNLQLTANSKQEGYSDVIKWPVQVCNPYSIQFSDAPNTWVAIELKPEDNSIQLQGIVDQNNNPLPVIFYGPRDETHPNGRNMMLYLGTMKLSACLQISVLAKYSNCEENKEQDVNVYASTDYQAYPSVTNYLGSVKDRKGCEGYLLSQTMSIKYKTAALQLEVRKTVSDAVDLCVPMNFEIDLTSTKYADMSQLKVWIELPHHLTVDAVTAPKFNYPYTSTATAIPATALLTENGKIGWDVTKIVGGNLPGIRLANNKLKLSFNLVSSCGFDPGLPVKFTVNGYTNCGEFVQFVDQRKVKLSGFELDDLQVQLNPVQSPECNKENDFTVVIKNNGTISTVTNQLEIVLPAGIEYRSTLQSDLPTATVTQENGTTKLLWTLLPGYLTAGEQKQLSIRTFLNGSSSVTRYKLVARTYQTSDALCAESNTSCATQATTGSSEYDIVVGLEGQLAMSMKKYLCSYHFKSNLQANDGCAITSYLWDFGDNTTSNESSPFHAFVQDGTYNVSLNITYSCGGCTGAQSQQLQVVVNSSPDEFDEIIIPVPTDTRLNVLQSSAATFADTWPVSYIDPALMDQNSYLNATQGVWRNNATYAYKASRNQSPNVNIKTDGTYSLLTFNWQYADLEAIPNWIKANSMTQYSPNSYELENKDVLGIYSAALYDYGGHLPSANGANMRNNEMGFTSFETTGAEQNNQVNQKLSGNLLWGTQQLPEYTRYEVYYGHGHMAIVKASIEELANVNKVDVTSKSILTFPFNRSNFIADDNIICRQPYTDNPEWTLLVLQVAPSVTFWQGSVRVKNDVQVTVTSDFSTAVAHSGKQSLHITGEQAFSQPLLQLDAKKNYLLNAWVSIGDVNRLTPKLSDDLEITVVLKDKNGQQLAMKSMQPSGPVIEGWQQIKGVFTIPDNSQTRVEIRFTPGSTGSAWYDDLRVHPENGNMKSYVYNLTDYRLQAIMDEENFASFYYYDKAGNLKLVKKETKDGIKTISENSSHVPAHN